MDCSHDIKDLPAQGGGRKVLVEVPSSSQDPVVKKLMKAPPTIPVVSAKPTDAASCALNVHICSITYRFIVTYLPMICFLVTWFMVPRCQAKHSLQDSLAKRLESKQKLMVRPRMRERERSIAYIFGEYPIYKSQFPNNLLSCLMLGWSLRCAASIGDTSKSLPEI